MIPNASTSHHDENERFKALDLDLDRYKENEENGASKNGENN